MTVFFQGPALNIKVCSNKNGILGVFFIALQMLFIGQAKAGAGLWGVLAPGLPERVSAADEATNVSFYILKQTHEPVFRRKDGENYSSLILDKWSRSLDYLNFSFCPAPHLEFAPGLPFTFEDFAAHVSSFTSGYSGRFHMVKERNCVNISFESPQNDYLYFWTAYERAPTKSTRGTAELGLGSFSVESVSKNRIVLTRKKKVTGGYNSVVLYAYTGARDPNLENREIKDFNLIDTAAVPEWVKESFLSFENPEMKSLILIINHPDPKVRERVYNCVDIPSLRSSFFPGKTDFYNISTLLPMGVPGAVPGLPAQTCGAARLRGELRFANWMPGNQEAMKKYAAAFKAKSGIKLRLDQYSMSEFAQAFSRRPKPFDLAVIIIYVPSSPKSFSGMFFKSGELYDFDIWPFSEKYRKLANSPGSITVEKAYQALSSEISGHALALPISQSKRTLYYPKEISNLSVGSGIIEYPEVAVFMR